MKVVALRQRAHLVVRRVADADPDELGLVRGAIDFLVDRDFADACSMAVEISGDDRHSNLGGMLFRR